MNNFSLKKIYEIYFSDLYNKIFATKLILLSQS
jgi:hypothetical protein